MECRIVLLSDTEKPVEVLKIQEPVNIIWSAEKEFTYLDHQGNVGEMDINKSFPTPVLTDPLIPCFYSGLFPLIGGIRLYLQVKVKHMS